MEVLERLESYLLPAEESIFWDEGTLTIHEPSTKDKVLACARIAFMSLVCLFAIPPILFYNWATQRRIDPIEKPQHIPLVQPRWPPGKRGFASSLFQTSGLGTKWSAAPKLAGRCDWDEWMDTPTHVKHPEGFEYKDFFTDVLSDPTAYIAMLKEHHVTAHRFSLEWSVIEPSPGCFDQKAIDLYRTFIHRLLEAGITPSVTLCHFVVPKWFYEQGNFQTIEHIDAYVQFALKAIEEFPEVQEWWSFNELGVKAFQQTREVYPTDLPEGSFFPKRVYAAGIATRNMLIAHCKLHQALVRLQGEGAIASETRVGVTHQWLKFDVASGNFIERAFKYFFEKFGFYPVFRFFKEGHYAFEFPFMANIHFTIPQEEFEANAHFLMQLGVQAYPKAMVKMGLNQGQKPPCAPGSKQTSLFTFGSCCEEGGAIMRFGPRWNVDGMEEILDEAFSLTDHVYITEYGSDANVHQWGGDGFEYSDAAQAAYLQQLTERIHEYSMRTGNEIKGLFCWSDLRRQLEWENGFECRLALVTPEVDEERRLIGWKSTEASRYLASVYQEEGGLSK